MDYLTSDFSNHFTTHEVFSSSEDIVEYAREIGKLHMMVLIIGNSKKANGNGRGRVWIRCERNGVYLRTRPINVDGARKSSTKKCGCKFEILGWENNDGTWSLAVNNGKHNHELATSLEGHAFVGKLKENELKRVSTLTKSHVKPQRILMPLHEEFEGNMSMKRHIYNARQKQRLEEMDGGTVLQHLMRLLVNNNYFQWHRSEAESNVLGDLLFANPVSIDILRAFPFILLMDCTYKTNRYGMPLLEIVGMTPTQNNFCVAFAFMSSEKEENYVWVLERVKRLMDPLMLPTTILTDRELALISAVERIFPSSNHLLCRYHVNNNVMGKCKIMKNEAFACHFLPRWKHLINATDEVTYEERLSSLEKGYNNMPLLLSYLKKYWLHPYKEKIVSAWTKRIFHIHQSTTNRAEGAHGSLKRFLETSTGSFNTIFPQIDSLLKLQHSNIRGELERSRFRTPHFATSALYDNLRGYVAVYALELIQKECIRVKDVFVDEALCGCYMRHTHGIRCSHELHSYIHEFVPIPLSAIHPFWKKLDFDTPITPSSEEEADNAAPHLLHVSLEAVMNQPPRIQNQLAREIYKIAVPHSITLQESEVRQRKGRPKQNSTRRDLSSWEHKKNYGYGHSESSGERVRSSPSQGRGTDRGRGRGRGRRKQSSSTIHMSSDQFNFPYVTKLCPHIVPYIDSWCNVKGDGNCGFRSLAYILLEDEENWVKIRMDLYHEILARRQLYEKVCEYMSVEELLGVIAHWSGQALSDHWMEMPDIGHVIATRYSVLFVCLSLESSYSFLPLVTQHEAPGPENEVVIAFLSCISHYIPLNLLDDCPLPPLNNQWVIFHDSSVTGWNIPYHSRFDQWQCLMPNDEDAELHQRFMPNDEDAELHLFP